MSGEWQPLLNAKQGVFDEATRLPQEPFLEPFRDFSAGFWDLVGHMLVLSPKDRPSAVQLLRHPYLRRAGWEAGGDARAGTSRGVLPACPACLDWLPACLPLLPACLDCLLTASFYFCLLQGSGAAESAGHQEPGCRAGPGL